MNQATHPTFDSEETAILSQITEEAENLPADDAAPGDTPAAATDAAPADAAPETPAAEPAKADAPKVDAAADKPVEPPQGDKTAALRASRRAEKRLREENDRLKADLEAARKAGPAPESADLTEDELASMKEDFPSQYKLYVKQKELEQRIAATPQPQAQPSNEFQPIEFHPDVQELVDQVPDLLAWQHDPAAQDKLKRAIAYDTALESDPDWIGKPVVERYAEAVARTKRALGAAPPAPTPPPVNRQDPAAVIAALEANGPKGISDFGSGQPASAPSVDYSRMTDEEILARLPATG